MPADIFAFAGRQEAWHREGNVLPDAETMHELHIAAGLDYRFELMPIYWEKVKDGQEYHIQERSKRLVTINGETSLGHIVSDDYQYHQPAELAATMDMILDASRDWSDSRWRPESALALGKGDTICYCISLGDSQVGGKACKDYLIVTDTVDGKHSLVAAVVKMVVVCRNTLRLALRTAKVNLAIRHTGAHRDVFKHTVENILESQGAVQETLELLAAKQVSDEQVIAYLDKLFEIPEKLDIKTPTVVKKMSALKLAAQGEYYRMVDNGDGPTAWTLFNAAQGLIEHSGQFSSPKVTQRALLTGTGEVVQRITQAYILAGNL